MTIAVGGKSLSDELKKCPFCGGKPKWKMDDYDKVWIECRECGSRTKIINATQQSLNKTEAELMSAWNRRTPDVDCDGASKTANGTCLGYSVSKADDEPCNSCKTCQKLEGYSIE
jgi:Lar family restriction alleviation protein